MLHLQTALDYSSVGFDRADAFCLEWRFDIIHSFFLTDFYFELVTGWGSESERGDTLIFHRYFFVFFVTGSVVSCSPWRDSSLQDVEQKSEASAYIVVLKKNKILEAGRAAGLANSDPQIVHTMATNLATRHSLTLNRVFSLSLQAPPS